MLLTSLTTYLRARRAPARVTALVLTGAVCALVARVPMPALSTDLDAAGYPAVLIASVGPVLLGVLAVAPAPTRLRWLTDTPGTRRRLLASVEFLIVVAMTSIAAAGVGLPADQVGVAVQNAALTGFGASVLAVPLGRGDRAPADVTESSSRGVGAHRHPRRSGRLVGGLGDRHDRGNGHSSRTSRARRARSNLIRAAVLPMRSSPPPTEINRRTIGDVLATTPPGWRTDRAERVGRFRVGRWRATESKQAGSERWGP
jgi:hypothetical protein